MVVCTRFIRRYVKLTSLVLLLKPYKQKSKSQTTNYVRISKVGLIYELP